MPAPSISENSCKARWGEWEGAVCLLKGRLFMLVQILAMDDFLTFKKMMIKANMDLELEVLFRDGDVDEGLGGGRNGRASSRWRACCGGGLTRSHVWQAVRANQRLALAPKVILLWRLQE